MAKADSTSTVKRPRKNAAEKAQADYDAAVKTRDAAQRKLEKLQQGVAPAQEAYNSAARRVEYLAQNPDLPVAASTESDEPMQEVAPA